MAAIAYPFLRINPARVIAPVWAWLDDPEQRAVPDQIQHWDHTTDLRLRRQVTLDFPAIAAALGHDADQLQLELLLTVGTGGARGTRRRNIWRRVVLSKDRQSFTLEVELAGEELSQAVTLRTEIVMHAPEGAGSVLAPRKRGLRLWGDLRTIILEPIEQRFSITTASFESEFPDSPRAPWRLRWYPGDLTRDFSGAVELFLNLDMRDFVERVSRPDPPVVSEVMHQVMSQIAREVLADDTLDVSLLEDTPTSVAAAVLGWLDRAFPGQDVDTVRQIMQTDPARFEARLGQFVTEGDNA